VLWPSDVISVMTTFQENLETLGNSAVDIWQSYCQKQSGTYFM